MIIIIVPKYHNIKTVLHYTVTLCLKFLDLISYILSNSTTSFFFLKFSRFQALSFSSQLFSPKTDKFRHGRVGTVAL